ncbi:lytic transglycosylase domain-containing protein [Sulfurimonas sp.]|uniref:lytic transglycosylase domain-containing protein n=1 Tax=Sulfurimonas sp. TaxID=2022749 RepID=UPI00262F4DAC|nr:lytic transglycosylase domain-containing protein [Sulfurimonas sp.]MCW8895145.1 LysM peptidoglycan-binding domain-containing protein [Sulfurimonas sp.]MCW9068289.1 LysM peptidoglycan-binding domain-containing protein [Sulfurimonas sp.]
MKYFLLIFLPVLVSASLTFDTNHNKEVSILESFDIEASFLYDPILNQMKNSNKTIYKDKRFFKAMDDAYLFIPAIKNILAQNNIPAEFLFLAMAESNFSTRAYSKKRASGLWQFIPSTGKLYGLKIDQYVDERRDLVKSTEAAAKFLTHLHKKFGKWYLAAIAYNCGGGRLSRAIKRAKTDDLSVLLDPKKKYIPRESRLYIRKIVALAMMGNDEQFLLNSEYEYLLNRANAYSIATVKVPRGESLNRISKLIGIPLDELKKLNRHLKYDFAPPYLKGYEMYIPYVKLSDFKQKYFEEKIQNIYRVHVVSRGENLSLIGKKYGVNYKVIMDFNKLKNSRLSLKQKLIIPIDNKAKIEKINSKFYYMVKSGDTLESISRAHKISVKSLKQQNSIKGSLIKVGERLKLYE